MVFQINTWKFFKNRPAKIAIVLLDDAKNSLVVAGLTALNLRIPKSDSSLLIKNPSGSFIMGDNPQNQTWLYDFVLTAEEIDSLALNTELTVELEIVYGDYSFYQSYPKSLKIIAPKL